jgi:hypothetical protein
MILASNVFHFQRVNRLAITFHFVFMPVGYFIPTPKGALIIAYIFQLCIQAIN